MSLSRRVQLAVLCLIVLAFSVATAAAGPLATGTVTLTSCGDEGTARGDGKLTVTGWDRSQNVFWGVTSVSCRGLTPGSTYLLIAASSRASGKGGVNLKCGWYGKYPTWVTVYRVEPDAYVPVLCGSVWWVWNTYG